MFSFFKKKKVDVRVPVNDAAAHQTAPNTEIRYDPNLIAHFKAHHSSLVRKIIDVSNALHDGDYSEVVNGLRAFRTDLQQHLLEENVRLYTYLSHCLQSDLAGYELMQEMRSEMNEIGKVAMRFTKHYIEFGVDNGNAQKFYEELKLVTSALNDRIKREESSLYTLYMPPKAFAD